MDMPTVILTLGSLALALFFILALLASVHESRKLKVRVSQDEDLRQLVRRYEQLAENTVDAQQRVAVDVADLRSRAASIEQILRTVE
jgi:anti-sigma-K factor RskA